MTIQFPLFVSSILGLPAKLNFKISRDACLAPRPETVNERSVSAEPGYKSYLTAFLILKV